MSENTVKIRLKFGQSEIDYEGPSSFLQNDLSALMKEMVNSYKDHDVPPTADPSSLHKEITEPNDKNGGIDFSMDMIASRMGKNTGPNLVLAASAYLTLVKQKTTFSRKDIIDEIKKATSYYRESMLGNLTKTLERLLKNQHLNQISSGNYSLSAAKKAEMENLLAKD